MRTSPDSLLLAKQHHLLQEMIKTSIIVYLEKNQPGALYEILGEFAGRNIDLTRIESRPTKKVLGDYVFYIDIKGHIEDKIIKETLTKIKRQG